jgi:beta-N-acetylhexosaminidase
MYIDADAPNGGDFSAARALADSVDAVVVGSYVATRWDAATIRQSSGFVDYVRSLSTGDKRLVVVAFGNPYLLQQIPDVPAYVVAWNGGQPAQSAAARGLAGGSGISGKLPISIPPVAKRGTGLTRSPKR